MLNMSCSLKRKDASFSVTVIGPSSSIYSHRALRKNASVNFERLKKRGGWGHIKK